ncbi:hypothetical protein Ahy_B03g062981 [Arachis hypogaea]|uniref:Uncharacterized protein n=1 Tax=Arachis hypogaea TaxID=3818 RepID=A0A444ZVW4_ARAHY|nr:hypothetical protein Ahy_B03g062981 [Arachis hypogaea]
MKRIEKLYYRIPRYVVSDGVKYDSFVIDSDEDLQVLFHCRRQFSKVRIPELLAKLVDVVLINISTTVMIPISRKIGEPDTVEDVLGDDDNVEPTMIHDDNMIT